MRKLLLAATAIIGATAGMASIANAQVTPPAVVVVPPPAPGATLPDRVAQPGTAVVHLNARFTFDAMFGSDSGNGYKNAATGITTKQQPYYFGEFGRLYPSFDGVTPYGLKYGAAMEIRQNGGGTGVNNAYANLSQSNGGTLYFRREMGYVGTDKLGTLRFGQTDGVPGLFMVGTFENVDFEGGWNGDLPSLFSSGATLAFAFPDGGPWYQTSKVLYLSPNFGGFDFGAQYELGTQSAIDTACGGVGANASNGNTTSATLTAGCATVSSESGTTADLSRRKDYVALEGRYRGVFGPIGVVVTAGWNVSGKVNDANPGVHPVAYNGFNFFDGGLVATYGGLVLGGHVDYGSKNNNTLQPKGAPDELDFSLGGSYAIGPVIAGVQFINESFQGSWNGNAATHTANTLGVEHDIGLAIGATYDWAPGSSLYVDYLWGTRHQANHDFFSGATGKFNNNTRAQGFIVGQKFQW